MGDSPVSDSAPLLQAILDAPDDDGLRLIYADWLEEHGDAARAEFIRVQVERANSLAMAGQQCDLQARGQALLAEHESAWVGRLAGWVDGWQFRRGLREGVRINP